VSKMFDALRRAEAERRQRMSGAAREESEREGTAVPKRETPVAPVPPVERPAAPQLRHVASANTYREVGILHNSIDTLLDRKARRTILFTSATRSEGTTTVATTYAELLTMKGEHRVLVVEMNARSPILARRFGLTNKGMSDYLSGGVPFPAVVSRVPSAGYDVVHVGGHDANRIQLLLERAFPRFLEEAQRHYDTVIIDAPPVFSAPETPPMTPEVDGVVMVLKCDKTKREIVQRSLAMIGQFNGNVLGVVLNRKKYYIPEFIYRRI